MRILCLDIGTKRIGIAVSDPMGWTAQGLETWERKGQSKDFEHILHLCQEYEVKKIIVGSPLDAEGQKGKSALGIEQLQEKLRAFINQTLPQLEVQSYDERYSTAEAEERLIAANVSRAKRKKVIDKMAAVVILENYLRELESTDI
ncbi:MAG: Holliday junction resolvase RuvX [Deltaproteobacteria bacterium CG11_big_fil_rev_8_21_14_0_20_42_23]|nr:MAG: Holliday junction resolvase RuvX [Deltaproteobacteria bacterium CG11_big_fil_rev_8_21_14_0_20_42_23]PJC64991.1 MAG: Holliday junction resolvase RuvX [Deltaproteobacteria bacterium CG_4_9_14_0_2_um_filter_42_21]